MKQIYLLLCSIASIGFAESEAVTVATEAGRSNILDKAFRWFEYINGPTNETMMVDGVQKKLGAGIKYWQFGNELTWLSLYPDYSHDDLDSDGIYDGAVVYNTVCVELVALFNRRLQGRNKKQHLLQSAVNKEVEWWSGGGSNSRPPRCESTPLGFSQGHSV
jgi:hypothetical protein